MADQLFQGFGQFSRPDIGLISDSFQNLSEIFDSDKRDALRNILIKPEVLDNLYELYTDITREDLRSASGLEKLLLPSLHQLTEVFADRIPTRLFVNKEFYNPDSPLGGVGSSALKQPNVILFNGAVRCRGARYRANTIGDSLFNSPLRQNVFLSSSRASLFNSELDEDNPGYFTSASFSGAIRVRRRSHINRILLPKSNFLAKAPVVENPSHTIRLNVDNGNTGTETQVRLLATKNSPLKVFCRMATGQVRLTFTDSAAPYFYGFQIQPAQQRPNRPPVNFLSVTQVSQLTGSTSFTVNIDITGTGYQNLYDLYLYLYVNPEKVTGIEFSGINIKETPDRKDLGLIGFNSLRTFKVTGGELTILPLWLKTLSGSLETLDLGSSGDRWRSGPMGWFDIRDSTATPSLTHPLYTAVSYLTVPKTGPLVNEDGDGWSDTLFEKYILNQSRTANTDYRVFSSMRSLTLNDRFLGRSPRFDDVFPNLTNLSWARESAGVERTYRYLFGNLPKINNNGNIISYNINYSGASGNIVQIGTSTDPSNSGHVSKYRFNLFSIGGRDGFRHDIAGYINNPAEDWSAWLQNTVSIDVNRTEVEINVQQGEWRSLTSLNISHSLGGVRFDNSSSPIRAPRLRSFGFYSSATTGLMPSLGTSSVSETGSLEEINLGGGRVSLSAVIENGINFLLPSNFAPARTPGNDHKLQTISINQSPLSFQFRQQDLINLHELTRFQSAESSLTGRFPIFPLKRLLETDTKAITIEISQCNYYDLTNLSIAPNNFYFSRDIRTISSWSQNTSDGGCLLPSLEGTSTTGIRVVDIGNSLPSTYRGDWHVTSLRGACVRDSDPATTLSGLSINRKLPTSANSTVKDRVFTLSGVSGLRQRILVNDSVRASTTGTELARVMSVSNTEVIIDRDIPDPLPSPLVFTRNTTDISDWFKTGFGQIQILRSGNNRLSGKFHIRNGFNLVKDTTFPAIDLSNNLLTQYETLTLSQIFRGSARKITVDLSNNNFDLENLRKIIAEVIELEKPKRFTNCLVRLSGNKLSGDNKYSNYTQQEVFPTSVSQGNDVLTSLSRNETFSSYRTVEVTDESGTISDVLESSGTRTIQVPGELVSGQYFKTQRDKIQGSQENPLAVGFKSLRGIRIDLGFTYVSPSTGSTVVSTTYEDPTTRIGSITDSGLNLLPSCPNGLPGTCWRRPSDGIILQLPN
jgi:hypothetical protein